MQKNMDLSPFFEKIFQVFKFWIITYSVFLVGFLTGTFVANSNNTIGALITMASGIVFIWVYIKNIKQEYRFLKYIKNTLMEDDNYFKEEIRKIYLLIIWILILDILLIGWFFNFVLKIICYFKNKRIRQSIKKYEEKIINSEKNKKIIQKHKELMEKMLHYGYISEYPEELEDMEEESTKDSDENKNEDNQESIEESEELANINNQENV